MSIAALVETLLSAGVDNAVIVAAVKAVEEKEPTRTARQERNARYYEARKGRLNASENRLNASDGLNSDQPPSEVSEGFPTPLPNLPNSPSKNPPKGGQKGSPAKTEKRAYRMPEDFVPGEHGKQAAAKAGMSPSVMLEQFEQFKNYHGSKGSRFVDWNAAWRTWCGNYRPRGGPPPRRESAETILGRIARGEPENGNSNGTVIEGRFAREDQGNGSQGVPLLPDLWPPARNL